MLQDYKFSNLDGRSDLLKQISELESKLQQETGEQVTLIAYSKEDDLGCRAGNND